jgi:hypothetical protein
MMGRVRRQAPLSRCLSTEGLVKRERRIPFESVGSYSHTVCCIALHFTGLSRISLLHLAFLAFVLQSTYRIYHSSQTLVNQRFIVS